MSLFVIVKRFSASQRIFRFRELASTLGENAQGILVDRDIKAPLFSLYSFSERYAVKPEIAEFKLNGSAKSPQQMFWVKKGDSLTGKDYTFTFLPTSNEAEVLAHAKGSIQDLEELHKSNEPLPCLQYQLAGLSRQFPLINNLNLTIGADEESAIYLAVPGCLKHHLTLKRSENEIFLKPIAGKTFVNDQEIVQEVTIPLPEFIRIDPPGIELKIVQNARL